MVDDHSRLAYSEILPHEPGDIFAGFYASAHPFFVARGICIQSLMTDNAFASTRSVTSDRTLLEGWAHVLTYRSDHARSRAFDRFLHTYHHHRPHMSLGGRPPMTRVNNAPMHHT